MKMNENTKNILVTGAAGFIGSHLVKKLIKNSYKVKAIDINLPEITRAIIEDQPSAVTNNFQFIEGDIEDASFMKNVTRDIDHVIHLAAKVFVPDSWKYPNEFYRTNVVGTANVLEACRLNKCGVTFNSSYVYGTPEYLPIDEKHPLKSYNPYSHSKLLAEEICKFYGKNYDLKVTVFRPFNVYGAGQKKMFLIPEIIGQVLSDNRNTVEVNDLIPKRDYLYIDDLISAFILSFDSPHGIFNIGSGTSFSVEEIINIVMKISGIDKPYSSKNNRRENEIDDVVADNSKACKELNWQVNTSINDGIAFCIDEYRRKLKQ